MFEKLMESNLKSQCINEAIPVSKNGKRSYPSCQITIQNGLCILNSHLRPIKLDYHKRKKRCSKYLRVYDFGLTDGQVRTFPWIEWVPWPKVEIIHARRTDIIESDVPHFVTTFRKAKIVESPAVNKLTHLSWLSDRQNQDQIQLRFFAI